MLITCPECELQVSDKAVTCPHCGYPLKAESTPRQTGKKHNRRRRLPNGFGQISEIKGQNLRKPFRAMVSVGKSSTGRPICKLLTPEAYFATYNEAYAALAEYNKHPYVIEVGVTLKDLYEKWSEKYFSDEISDARVRAIQSAWDYCKSIHDVPASDIRPTHVEYCMDHGEKVDKRSGKLSTPSVRMKDNIKTTLAMVLDYGIKNGVVDKNYARMVSLSKADRKYLRETAVSHVSFTSEELETLWANSEMPFVDMILIDCYMGWRPSELCDLKVANVNLNEWSCVGGNKTESGKNRIVPIHSRIRDLIKRYYDEAEKENAEYLFCRAALHWNDEPRINYKAYVAGFNSVVKKLQLNSKHKPHDCRKTFITRAKSAGMDEYALKRMVGHKITDITESVYTERPFTWLAEEIEKIK